MRSLGINGTCIVILEDIYTGATARAHLDNQVSEEIPILRGVRQRDPIFPILSTVTVKEMLKLQEKGINIDGQT